MLFWWMWLLSGTTLVMVNWWFGAWWFGIPFGSPKMYPGLGCQTAKPPGTKPSVYFCLFRDGDLLRIRFDGIHHHCSPPFGGINLGIYFPTTLSVSKGKRFPLNPKGKGSPCCLCHHFFMGIFFMGQDVSFTESISWTCGNLRAVASHPVPQKHSRQDYHPLNLNIKTKWCQKRGRPSPASFFGANGGVFSGANLLLVLRLRGFLNFDQIFYGQSSPTAQSNVHLHPQK